MTSGHPAGAGGRPVQAPTRRIALIIWSALFASVAAFAVLATVLRPGFRQQNGEAPELLVWVALGMALVTFLMSRILPGRIKTAAVATADGIAVSRTIIAASLNEGSALFAVIVWMLGGRPLSLVPLAVSVAGLLLAFPSEARWRKLCAGAGETQQTRLVR